MLACLPQFDSSDLSKQSFRKSQTLSIGMQLDDVSDDVMRQANWVSESQLFGGGGSTGGPPPGRVGSVTEKIRQLSKYPN